MQPYTVIFSNSGGELNRRDAASDADARDVAIALLQEVDYLSAGDTLRVVANHDDI